MASYYLSPQTEVDIVLCMGVSVALIEKTAKNISNLKPNCNHSLIAKNRDRVVIFYGKCKTCGIISGICVIQYTSPQD